MLLQRVPQAALNRLPSGSVVGFTDGIDWVITARTTGGRWWHPFRQHRVAAELEALAASNWGCASGAGYGLLTTGLTLVRSTSPRGGGPAFIVTEVPPSDAEYPEPVLHLAASSAGDFHDLRQHVRRLLSAPADTLQPFLLRDRPPKNPEPPYGSVQRQPLQLAVGVAVASFEQLPGDVVAFTDGDDSDLSWRLPDGLWSTPLSYHGWDLAKRYPELTVDLRTFDAEPHAGAAALTFAGPDGAHVDAIRIRGDRRWHVSNGRALEAAALLRMVIADPEHRQRISAHSIVK